MRIGVVLIAATLVAACSEEKYPGLETTERSRGTDSGLRIIDMVQGEGQEVEPGDMVVVHYTGYLMSGKKFDSSLDGDEPFSFTVGRGRVIKGWDEGLLRMKPGGKRKLIIPAHLAYGDRNLGGIIPPNSDLVFDIDLLEVHKGRFHN